MTCSAGMSWGLRKDESGGYGGEGYDESGDGACGGDDEEGGAGADAALDAEDGSGGSAKGWGGKEVGQGDLDAVEAACEEVAELVGYENGKDGEGERQAAGEVVAMLPDPMVGEDVGIGGEGDLVGDEIRHVAHADHGGRGDGEEEEDEVQPEALAPAWETFERSFG